MGSISISFPTFLFYYDSIFVALKRNYDVRLFGAGRFNFLSFQQDHPFALRSQSQKEVMASLKEASSTSFFVDFFSNLHAPPLPGLCDGDEAQRASIM